MCWKSSRGTLPLKGKLEQVCFHSHLNWVADKSGAKIVDIRRQVREQMFGNPWEPDEWQHKQWGGRQFPPKKTPASAIPQYTRVGSTSILATGGRCGWPFTETDVKIVESHMIEMGWNNLAGALYDGEVKRDVEHTDPLELLDSWLALVVATRTILW